MITKIRSGLYRWGKLLGHVQAIEQAVKKGSITPVLRRIGRVYAGKMTARGLGKLFGWK